jgi:putative tricarboxylic transport membrane protein
VKLNDALWGALFLLLSVAILVHVQSFPAMPGQKVGPALFPGVIAAALAACALLLVGRGLAARAKAGESAAWVDFGNWVRSPRQLLAFALVVGANVFYILVVDRLGFIPTAVIYLTALFLVFGVRFANSLLIAVAMTLVIHYAFYKLLRVPLPWGWLTKWAW